MFPVLHPLPSTNDTENGLGLHSQNHRMFGVGRDLCGSPSPTPCPSRVTQSRLHSTASRRGWNISREGDSTTSLGSLGQGSVTLRGKKFFLVFVMLPGEAGDGGCVEGWWGRQGEGYRGREAEQCLGAALYSSNPFIISIDFNGKKPGLLHPVPYCRSTWESVPARGTCRAARSKRAIFFLSSLIFQGTAELLLSKLVPRFGNIIEIMQMRHW